MQGRILLIKPLNSYDNCLVYSQILNKDRKPTLHYNKTDWNAFSENLDKLISLD